MNFFKMDPAFQAYRLLQFAFVVAPIIVGLDKLYTNFLVPWTIYLAPITLDILGGHAEGFMQIVGVIEIIAGIGVAVKPKVFSYVVALWLLCIIINLLFAVHYYDIVVRDVGLLFGALALGKLSKKYG